jgi:hypothetical protein
MHLETGTQLLVFECVFERVIEYASERVLEHVLDFRSRGIERPRAAESRARAREA